jgi:hypothetical protein
MKTYRKMTATLTALASVLMMTSANARHVDGHNNGIAASPKAQAFLASFNTTGQVPDGADTVNRGMMAMSPRAHQFLTDSGYHPEPVMVMGPEIVSLSPEEPYYEPFTDSTADDTNDPQWPDYQTPDLKTPDATIPDVISPDPALPDPEFPDPALDPATFPEPVTPDVTIPDPETLDPNLDPANYEPVTPEPVTPDVTIPDPTLPDDDAPDGL